MRHRFGKIHDNEWEFFFLSEWKKTENVFISLNFFRRLMERPWNRFFLPHLAFSLFNHRD